MAALVDEDSSETDTDEEPKDPESECGRLQKKQQDSCDPPTTFNFPLQRESFLALMKDYATSGQPYNRLSSGWTNVMATGFCTMNNLCVLAFKTNHLRAPASRKKSSPVWQGSGKCTFRNCCSYKFIVHAIPQVGDITVHVIRKGGSFNLSDMDALGTPLKRRRNKSGNERKHLRELLEKSKPKRLELQLLWKADSNRMDRGNMDQTASHTTLRKISSEALKEKDKSSDEWEDLVCEAQDSSTTLNIFILEKVEFKVAWTSAEQVDMMKKMKGPIIFFLDCTGKKTLNPNGYETYYYAIVVKPTKETPPLPVAGLVSDSHTTPDITYFLAKFVYHVKISGFSRTPFPSVCVIDFSWALLHAAMGAFNHMHITDYLIMCFELETSEKTGYRKKALKKTAIHICAAHSVHDVKVHASSKLRLSRKKAKIVKQIFQSIQRTETFEEGSMVVMHAARILGRKWRNKHVEESLLFVENHPKVEGEEAEHPAVFPKGEEHRQSRETLYSQSPYYHHFKAICDREMDVEEEDEFTEEKDIIDVELNDFYCPAAIEYLLKRWLAFFPLVCAMFVKPHSSPSSGLLVNTPAEIHFRITKYDIMFGVSLMRVARFVRLMHDAVVQRVRAIEYPTTVRRKRKTPSATPQSVIVQKGRKTRPSRRFRKGERKKQ